MPVRRRRSFRSSGRSRRKLIWATHEFAGVTLAMGGDTAAQSFDLLEDLRYGDASVLGSTIMRTHMRLQVQFLGGIGNFPRLRYGLSVDQLRNTSTGGHPALDIASANSPGGLTNDEMAQYLGINWALLDTYIPLTMVSGKSANQTPTGFTLTEGWFVDLKSRRKVQEVNETWALSFYVEDSGTDPQFSVSGFTRTLVALP